MEKIRSFQREGKTIVLASHSMELMTMLCERALWLDGGRVVLAGKSKEVVIVNEAPGFITTRVNALIGNEAFNMLEAGIASPEDIDKALKLGLNHPMGPFELVDLVGLDVRLKILEYLHKTLGEKYRPNRLLRQYIQEGRLGCKSGRGVYDYAKQKTAEKNT